MHIFMIDFTEFDGFIWFVILLYSYYLVAVSLVFLIGFKQIFVSVPEPGSRSKYFCRISDTRFLLSCPAVWKQLRSFQLIFGSVVLGPVSDVSLAIRNHYNSLRIPQIVVGVRVANCERDVWSCGDTLAEITLAFYKCSLLITMVITWNK